MVRTPQASDVSARVAFLIARHHGGDRRVAAQSLGIEPERLAGLLSGDWRRFSLDALATLVCSHDVNVRWLLGSDQSPRRREPLVRTDTSQRERPHHA